MISQGRHTGYPTEKSKIYTGFGLKHAARKCWDCEKKEDLEGELGRISSQMPVVHLVQRNVKERTADTPLILVNFF